MKDILEYIDLLKAGVSKENYPLYTQHINATDGVLRTCNDQTYIQVNLEVAPFEWNANLFVLESMLKTLPDNFTVTRKGDMLFIKAPKLDYELKISDFKFPKMEKQDVKMFDIDEGILEILKLASVFTGKDNYESVYIDSDGIVSASTDKVLIYETKTGLEKPVMLSKKLISILEPGFEIGSEDNDNTMISFPKGFGIFVTTPHYSVYPAEKIREYISSNLKNTEDICLASDLQKLVSRVSPIFFGESQHLLSITNNNNVLTIKAETPFNGKAEASCESQSKMEFGLILDASLLNIIPAYFTISTRGEDTTLVATDGIVNLLLVG